MDDLGVIDRFVATFTAYIDSGFGLLAPDVAYLTTFVVTIDIVLAGLFWALGAESNVIAQLIKKVLYVGVFALIIGNFQGLADIVFASFAQLGLQATGTPLTAADLLRPGFVADTGFTAAHPLLDEIEALTGPVGFFVNIVTIAILFLAWLVTLFAFFFLAIQLFVTIVEFKLTTLAGFVLVPFALWNKTAFLAEKVLGNVVASGIKLMVLAVIVGIGSTLFGTVTAGFTPGAVTLEDATTVILASMALLALGIFGPGIATGLVSGAPQLGAGAAVGAAAGIGAGAVAGGAIGAAGAKAIGGGAVSAVKAGASVAGGARSSFALGAAASGASGGARVAAGLGGMAQAAGGAMSSGASRMTEPVRSAFQSGARRSATGTGGTFRSSAASAASDQGASGAPAWARQARRSQVQRDAGMAATTALRDGDRGGAGEGPRLKQDEE